MPVGSDAGNVDYELSSRPLHAARAHWNLAVVGLVFSQLGAFWWARSILPKPASDRYWLTICGSLLPTASAGRFAKRTRTCTGGNVNGGRLSNTCECVSRWAYAPGSLRSVVLYRLGGGVLRELWAAAGNVLPSMPASRINRLEGGV